MRTLEKLYISNLIPYPRVFNGYSIVSFSHFPHKEMPIVNKFLEPLRKDSYELSQETFPLFLSNIGLSEYSRIQSIKKYLIENFDNELRPKKNKQKKIEELREAVNIQEQKKEVYSDSSYYENTIYKPEDIFAFRFNPMSLVPKNSKAKIRDNVDNFEDVEAENIFTNVYQAIDAFMSRKQHGNYDELSRFSDNKVDKDEYNKL